MNATIQPTINELHLKKHLQALGYDEGDRAYIRGFFPVKGRDGGRMDSFIVPDIPVPLLGKWAREGRGIYLVVNGGGNSDEEVTECRAIFYEHDAVFEDGLKRLQGMFPDAEFPYKGKNNRDEDEWFVPKQVQQHLWAVLNLPEPTVQIDTGGKSIHNYWVFDEPCNSERWKILQTDLIAYSDGDRQLKNPSRVMRLAGCPHAKTGEIAKIVGGHATRYSYDHLRDIIPVSENDGPSVDGIVTWSQFDKAFRFPISDTVPLEQCLSRNNRELLLKGASADRNNNGFQLAAALIGTSGYLTGEGQRFDGDPYDLFIQYCQNCTQGDGWNQHEWDSIWKSAQKKPREIKMQPEWIVNLVKAWAWKNRPQSKPVDVAAIGKRIPDSVHVEIEEIPEDADGETRLRMAIANYVKVRESGNRFQQIPLKGAIARDFGISKGEVEELANELSRGRAGDLTVSADLLIPMATDIEERSLGKVEVGIASGFHDLDAMTQGFQRSDLIIVAGRPSMGKTSYVLNIARHVSEKHPIAIFSLETAKEQLAYRFLATESRVHFGRLRSGRIAQQEWTPIGNAINSLAQLPIYVDDTPGISVAEIASKLKRLESECEQKPGLVMIDYLQLMSGSGDNRVLELSGITRSLKGLAREMNVPIIALSQLSRGVESRTDKRPMMSDIRDSGGIEQDADLIIMLYRDEYYNPDSPDRGIAEAIITKHRNGPVGTVKIVFDREFTEFKNLKNAGW